MKTISTMRALLAVSLLFICILTGCQKDPQPTPQIDYIFGSSNTKTPAPVVAPVRN
jgi:hypothetical protein